jgi:hypothetical protein
MHAQLFHQFPFTGDPVEIADQQHAQQQFRVDRWSPCVAVGVLQFGANKIEVDVSIDQTQQMIFRNLVFETEVVEQRFRAREWFPIMSSRPPKITVNTGIGNSGLLIT